jgi:hypothetical protein
MEIGVAVCVGKDLARSRFENYVPSPPLSQILLRENKVLNSSLLECVLQKPYDLIAASVIEYHKVKGKFGVSPKAVKAGCQNVQRFGIVTA